MQDFEKLGAFYLGRPYDLATRKRGDGWLLYDSRDLVTHAVCVGMTGSGKTGLCLALLEEAAIDGVPGDCHRPEGRPGQPAAHLPRPSARATSRRGSTRTMRGAQGVSGERVRRAAGRAVEEGPGRVGPGRRADCAPAASADFAIYTPGSEAGLPVSILKSLAGARPAACEGEALRERVTTTVTQPARPARHRRRPGAEPRPHPALDASSHGVVERGQDLDLAALIQQIQSPPMPRVGVFDLESFYPAKERFGLAMALNNLLAVARLRRRG